MAKGAARIAATLGTPTHAHPYLSAVQFAQDTNKPKDAGATQNLRTGHIIPPHTPGYMVGGEKDSSGTKVKMDPHPGPMDPIDAMKQRFRLKAIARSPSMAMGSWRDTEKPNADAEIDLSHVYQNRDKAERVGRDRGETAIWDNQNMNEIRL